MAKRFPLSNQLNGLAEWLESGGYEHNAKMVRKAARLIARDIERDLSRPTKRKAKVYKSYSTYCD